MLFFISNVALHLYNCIYESSLKMKLLRLVNKHVKAASIMLRKSHPGVLEDGARQESVPTQELVPPECTTQLWADNTIEVTAVRPQMHVDLSSWTSYLSTQNYSNSSLSHGNCHILLEVNQPDDPQDFLDRSMSIPPAKRVKVMDLANPIAWKSGTPFSIVAECSPTALVDLGIGLKEGRLMLDDMLELNCITTVSLHGHAINLLRSLSGSLDVKESSSGLSADKSHISRQSSWTNILDSLHSVLEDPIVTPAEDLSEDSNESLASLPLAGEAGGLSASQQFIAGLKAQHDRVKQVKNMRYESDSESSSLMGDTAAGEAPSESLELLAPEVLTPAHRRNNNRNKPPNVLVYCGKKDALLQYEAVKSIFTQCLNPDRYTIYHLKHEQVSSSPWMDNSVLLVIASDKIFDGVDEVFMKYFTQGGSVISFGSSFDAAFVERVQMSKNIGCLSLNYRQWQDVTVICGRYMYKDCDTTLSDVNISLLCKDKKTGKPVIVEASHELSEGVALLTQVHFDKDPVEMAISPDIFSALKKSNQSRFDILRDLLTQLGLDCCGGQPPKVTPCFLMATNESAKKSLLAALKPRLQERLLKARDLSLLFCNHGDDQTTPVTSEVLPVYTDAMVTADKFDMELYKRYLTTDVLGHVVFYAEVVNTTMNFFEGMMFSVPQEVGLITIASRQTCGQGRGGNTWLSPPGCAMFSVHVRISLDTELGQRVGFLQHIASLAVVLAVTQSPGYQNLDLRLKWPNDIYYGSTMKLGGVIAKSSIMADVIHANIGCGFNVTNQDPTICINDLVQQYNLCHGTTLPPFTVEYLLASTVVQMEKLIALFQEQGKQAFLDKYYQKWLHSNAHVHLQAQSQDVTVSGVDDYGFLQVQSPEGTLLSVHPDGNSFDMMRNLIIPKSR